MRYVVTGGVEGRVVSFARAQHPRVMLVTAACAAKHCKTYKELQRLCHDKATPLVEVHRLEDLVATRRPEHLRHWICCNGEIAEKQRELEQLATTPISATELREIVVSMTAFLKFLGELRKP